MPAAKTAGLACVRGGGVGWQSFCRLGIYGSSLLPSPSTKSPYVFLGFPLLRAQDEPTETRTEVPTWNSAQCYMAAWMGGEVGGEWIHVFCCCCCSVARSVRLFPTLWTASFQASLSLTISQSLPKFMSIELIMIHV